ncbi:AIPR family protein [Tissierella pigra]|uniref:AIPR family protein n=1 Tax=Tissierella pigra TaxID=2607614 RepID=UPI001C0FA5BA|nr:AIPR family protein [Tissierella pigra]MBU5428421.1 AIPR family protein [Tissierella pigra]
MSKNLTNNQILLNELIRQEFDENKNYTEIDDFFELFVAEQYLKDYDLSYEELEQGIKGNGLDGGCDGIYLFLNGMLINEDIIDDYKFPKDIKLDFFIIQAKNTTSFNEDVIMKWKTISDNLLQMSNNISEYKGRYNEDVLNSFQLFQDLFIKLIRNKIKLSINYAYISKGTEIHPNVKEQANELKNKVKSLFPNPNVTVSVDFIGADRLMELTSISNNRSFNLKLMEPPITIDARKDYVALVNLGEYFRFITNENNELIKHIFESNVRDYQGNTIVNTEIQDTLQNTSIEDFWWLNNGITVLASEAILATGKELIISDPEIVNGLQTSTEIFNYFSKLPEKVEIENRSVLIRVIVPENEESRDRIILATNSQTTIPKSSLRATDPIHRQIEIFLKTRGLYYDRRKNYYKNHGKKAVDIVSVSFLSQCLMSILLQKPDYARARPSTLLTNDDSYNKLYIENENLKSFYNAAFIGKKVEKYIKNLAEYSRVEKGDILFYVIYSVTSSIVRKTIIKPNDLGNIDLEKINDELIQENVIEVYRMYQELGGNSKVAKGSELSTTIQEALNKCFNSEK